MSPIPVARADAESWLQRFPLLQSGDLDEVREQVGRVFCEHRLRVVEPGQRLDTRLYFRPGRQLGLGRLHYGASVEIDPGELKDFFLLQLPLSGQELITAGRHVVESTAETASIVSPTLPFRMRHARQTDKLFVRIERAALERQYCQSHARPLRGPLEFVPEIRLPAASTAALRRLLAWLFAEATDGMLLDQPLVAARLEETLMTALLETLPHNQPPAARAEAGLAPRFVLRAEDFMAEHAHEPLTAAEIAAHVGVSTRSLFAGFRRYRNGSPMRFLRELRLQRVREELLSPPPGERPGVTRTAMRWGFEHLGQFSAAYRRCYGELPSQTLARAQQGG